MTSTTQKPSVLKLVQEQESFLKPTLKERIKKILRVYRVTDPQSKINFDEFENPTVAAYTCYQIFREFSEESKSYFSRADVVESLYKDIAEAIQATDYTEEQELKTLKETLSNLHFSARYHHFDFGFYITSDNKFGGYIYDKSKDANNVKVKEIHKALREFEKFSFSPEGSIPVEYNIPDKEVFEAYSVLKSNFIVAVQLYGSPFINNVALNYGYINNK